MSGGCSKIDFLLPLSACRDTFSLDVCLPTTSRRNDCAFGTSRRTRRGDRPRGGREFAAAQSTVRTVVGIVGCSLTGSFRQTRAVRPPHNARRQSERRVHHVQQSSSPGDRSARIVGDVSAGVLTSRAPRTSLTIERSQREPARRSPTYRRECVVIQQLVIVDMGGLGAAEHHPLSCAVPERSAWCGRSDVLSGFDGD